MFLCAGIAPRDKEVNSKNIELPDFNYDEPDPPIRTPKDVSAEFRRPDHHGKLRMVVAGDGACPNQGTKVARLDKVHITAVATPAISPSEHKAHAKAQTAQNSVVCSEEYGGCQETRNTSQTTWQ